MYCLCLTEECHISKLPGFVIEHLQHVVAHAESGNMTAVFLVGIMQDGPNQVVYAEPDERESLIIAINEELTRMLGSPHHVVSTEKLQLFLAKHGITDVDLLAFGSSNDADTF